MTVFDPVNRIQRRAKTAGGFGLAFFLGACSSLPSHDKHLDYFEVYGDSIPLLTNDVIAKCQRVDLDENTFCIHLIGKVDAEKTGKVLAYGLLLDEAGWFNFEPPIEEFVSADALKTPDYVSMHFRKTVETGCDKELILTPRTLSGTEKTELSISKQNLDCNE
ncbi:hypothetical protein [Hellea balneolensis]|uniref:hypothetical protein n=1 Tax=Hellea balneolensis TaxID=287478 RepID=UPI00047A6417|nr:hypothetical protein [Hellea balneolensis]